MANAITAVQGTTAVDHTPQPQKAAQTPAKSSPLPNDTVTLSQTAKPAPAASQTTKTTQASGDVDHDGDSR